MQLPLKIDNTSAQQIAFLITHKGATRHLLKDRLNRLKEVAKRPLKEIPQIQKFIKEFLTDANIYFSFLRISPFHPITNNVESLTTKRVILFLEEAFKLTQKLKNSISSNIEIPIPLVGNRLTHHKINDQMYIYCIKGDDVLVLSGKIRGNIAPENISNIWHLTFEFVGITFLNFENTGNYIISEIENSKNLTKYNMLLSWLFPIFQTQAEEIELHSTWEKIDRDQLATLSDQEEKLLGIYLPIFDRYGDADPRILKLCNQILDYYKKYLPDLSHWVVYSPSYCLPIWFVDFYEFLNKEDQIFLDNLDLNEWTDAQLLKIISLLQKFLNHKKAETVNKTS